MPYSQRRRRKVNDRALLVPKTRADQERRELYASSVERHATRLREAARGEWSLFHEHVAQIHRSIALEHEEHARKLLEEGRSS